MSEAPAAERARLDRRWPRALAGLQLALGWLPIMALYTALIVTQHHVPVALAAKLALRSLIPAVLLGILVYRFAERTPWSRPFRSSFVLVHMAAALAYACAWVLAASIVESAIHRHLMIVVGPGLVPFLLLGVWLYVLVAGISYAIAGTERAARAEAASVRMQLGALRSQLHPHFLFNALHTVVQLIPVNPERASEAAERLAALLRTALEENRDLVSLHDEWSFVSKYLDLERIRFGDRLVVRTDMSASLMHVRVPSFALQTLVENAVRHGAAPRIDATVITIEAHADERSMTLRVEDTGAGSTAAGAAGEPGSGGTGLARLRERLAALYGDAARLDLHSASGGGFTATLTLPRTEDE